MLDRKAPTGQFRVIGVDTFEGPTSEYLIRDCTDLMKAMRLARERGGIMNPVYVFDSEGKMIFSTGTP